MRIFSRNPGPWWKFGARPLLAEVGEDRLRADGLANMQLQGADLEGADLRNVNLCLTNLEGASLARARLEGATLGGAYLRGVDLRHADLRGASLKSAVLHNADLTGALYDARTEWPAGVDPVARGAELHPEPQPAAP